MKRVIIISYYFPPSGGAGVQRWTKFVKYLRLFDIEPIVITVDENKASYPFQDTTLLKDIPEGIRVIRTNTSEPFKFYNILNKKKEIPHSGFANSGNPSVLQKIFRFIRGNLFIPDARVGWNKYAYKAAKEIILKENINTVITTSPPHSTQLVGLKLKQKFNINWIADLRDPWTDIYYYKELFHLNITKQKDLKYEKTVLENADEIIVVSEDLKRLFNEKSTLIKSNKINVIPNGFDEEDFSLNNNHNDNFTITYTGTIADNYHVEGFFNAFANFVKNNKAKNIKLRLVGIVSESKKLLISSFNLENYVEYVSYVKHTESIKYLQKSDVLLLIIQGYKNNKGLLTGKLFEYLAAKKYILCIGPENGDAAQIINECNSGETIFYDKVDTVSSVLTELYEKWSLKKELYLGNENHYNYSRKNLTLKLSKIIKKY
ncbi:MAG: hypothetical protein A2X12_04650 [Bacteroidetes bacterium GWE2_29_8]|nr:MAG: hypothetical protein A2X12_04650 [Bacteroidetes bacterium GWE2_29_8]